MKGFDFVEDRLTITITSQKKNDFENDDDEEILQFITLHVSSFFSDGY